MPQAFWSAWWERGSPGHPALKLRPKRVQACWCACTGYSMNGLSDTGLFMSLTGTCGLSTVLLLV